MVAEQHELRGPRDGPSFKKAIAFSVALHFGLFGTALLVFPSKPRRLFYAPAYTVSLVGPGALRGGKPPSRAKVTKRPAQRAKALKPVKKVKKRRTRPRRRAKPKAIPLKKATRAKTKKKVTPKAPSREAKKALEPTPRVARALERIRQKLAKEEAREVAVAGAAPARGSGGTPGGGSAGLTDLPFREYYNLIWERVRDAWVLPENIAEGERQRLVAIVEFRVADTGEISRVRLESSSGNTYFDNSALRAIQKVNPLPPFPPELGRPYLVVGVRFHNPND